MTTITAANINDIKKARPGDGPVRLLICLALAFCLGVSGLAQAATINATPATLAVVLKAAARGDIVALGPYVYSNPIFKAGNLPDGLTVDATGATITNAKVYSAANLTIVGGTWGHGCTGSCSAAAALWVEGAPGFTIKNAAFVGGAVVDGYGIKVLNETGFTVADTTFAGFRTGIPIGNSRDGVIRNVSFTGMSSDGVAMGSAWNILIDGITCKGGVPFVGAHPDCVQGWSRADLPPTADIRIRGMVAGGNTDGALMSNKGARSYPAGTKLADGSILAVATNLNDGGFDRISIEDSVITVSQANGASFNFCRDCTMKNVKVATAPDSTIGARVYVSPDSTMRLSCGNSYGEFGGMKAWADAKCPPVLTAEQTEIAGLKAQVATLTGQLAAANDNLAAANTNTANAQQGWDKARAEVDRLRGLLGQILVLSAQ